MMQEYSYDLDYWFLQDDPILGSANKRSLLVALFRKYYKANLVEVECWDTIYAWIESLLLATEHLSALALSHFFFFFLNQSFINQLSYKATELVKMNKNQRRWMIQWSIEYLLLENV